MAQKVGRGIALLFHEGVSVRQHAPATLHPWERPGTHFIGGWGGPQGRSGRVENLVPTEIRSRTVQPIVSRYTD